MKPDQLRKAFREELSKYLKYAHIARVSGGTRQQMNWWLKDDRKGTNFSPAPGINELKLLCLKISVQSTVSTEDWKQLKKFIKTSTLVPKFLGISSSTLAVNISRKGIEQYSDGIKEIADFIRKKLTTINVKKRKKSGKKIALKLKNR